MLCYHCSRNQTKHTSFFSLFLNTLQKAERFRVRFFAYGKLGPASLGSQLLGDAARPAPASWHARAEKNFLAGRAGQKIDLAFFRLLRKPELCEASLKRVAGFRRLQAAEPHTIIPGCHPLNWGAAAPQQQKAPERLLRRFWFCFRCPYRIIFRRFWTERTLRSILIR